AGRNFRLAGHQRRCGSGEFRYDSLRTSLDGNPVTPAIVAVGASHYDFYTLSGKARYYVGDTFFGGLLSGNRGTAGWTDNVDNISASFRTSGYLAAGSIGHTFTLFDSRRRVVATKGRPKPTPGGYAVHLLVGADLGYFSQRNDSFVDSSGFLWGQQRLRFWDAAGQAQLYWLIPRGALTWRPFVAATV